MRLVKEYWLFFVLLVAVLFAAMFADRGEARAVYNEETKMMEITGGTDMATWEQANKIFKERDVLAVSMWGPGGDVRAAIALGRLVRKENVPIIIPENRLCISACAAIASAGSNKVIVDGTLYYHGGYLTNIPAFLTFESYGRAVSHMNIELAYLFDDWGYGRDFYKWVMYRTSPCRFFAVDNSEDFYALKEGKFRGKFIDNCPTQEYILGAH